MVHRATINQLVQVGAESVIGTAVAANKILGAFTWTFGINGDVVYYTPTGHKYASTQEENTEWVDGTLSGDMDYNAVVYPLAGVMGDVNPTTHGSSATAKDWVFNPPITGSVAPQTYTIEQGDAVRAHKFAYALFNQWGYTGTRKALTCSGTLFGQLLSDGIAMTASPAEVAIAPIPAKQVSIYFDTTQAALGTTLYSNVTQYTYSMGNVYTQFWPVNRANASFAAHIDAMPATTFKLKLEADAQGMGFLPKLQSGATGYLRVAAVGNLIDNSYTVSLGAASAGNFTLTYKGQTTANIAFNAAASAVQTAFTGLSTVGAGNATVTGSAGGPYTLTFIGTLASDLTAPTGAGVSLTGGTFLITAAAVTQAFTHDMAVKVGKPSTFADDQGVYAIEWDMTVVEDATWGHSQTCTVTNQVSAL